MGYVFFTGFLSKHLRCLALWLLSGREVFVTVAKPTPSVMAHRRAITECVNVYEHTFTHMLSQTHEAGTLTGCMDTDRGVQVM